MKAWVTTYSPGWATGSVARVKLKWRTLVRSLPWTASRSCPGMIFYLRHGSVGRYKDIRENEVDVLAVFIQGKTPKAFKSIQSCRNCWSTEAWKDDSRTCKLRVTGAIWVREYLQWTVIVNSSPVHNRSGSKRTGKVLAWFRLTLANSSWSGWRSPGLLSREKCFPGRHRKRESGGVHQWETCCCMHSQVSCFQQNGLKTMLDWRLDLRNRR